MKIRQLATRSGTTAKNIRYFESIKLLPDPQRQPNGYRVYEEEDVERLKLILGARNLDVSLDDIREILDIRDRHEAPCRTLLDLMTQKIAEVSHQLNANPNGLDLLVTGRCIKEEISQKEGF